MGWDRKDVDVFPQHANPDRRLRNYSVRGFSLYWKASKLVFAGPLASTAMLQLLLEVSVLGLQAGRARMKA